MLKFATTNKKLLIISIALLNNKNAKNSELSQSSQPEDRLLANLFSPGQATSIVCKETNPIPPYDDPLY
jgi:hypothetical protein